MAQPERNERTIYSCLKQFHSGCMSKYMWRQALLRQGGAVLLRHGGVFGYQILDGVGAQRTAARARKQDLGTLLSLFLHPRDEHTRGRLRQGCASLLASFSLTSDMSSGTETDIILSKVGDLGES